MDPPRWLAILTGAGTSAAGLAEAQEIRGCKDHYKKVVAAAASHPARPKNRALSSEPTVDSRDKDRTRHRRAAETGSLYHKRRPWPRTGRVRWSERGRPPTRQRPRPQAVSSCPAPHLRLVKYGPLLPPLLQSNPAPSVITEMRPRFDHLAGVPKADAVSCAILGRRCRGGFPAYPDLYHSRGQYLRSDDRAREGHLGGGKQPQSTITQCRPGGHRRPPYWRNSFLPPGVDPLPCPEVVR